jgi:hypothetical protein
MARSRHARAPAELRGDIMDLQAIAASTGGSDALTAAAGQAGLAPDQAQSVLQGVLEHAAEGGGAEGMVDAVAGKTGIDPAQIQAFLPQVMPLLQGHADGAGDQGMLGGLLGSVGGLLGSGGGSAEGGGGLLGLASGLFGNKG